MNESANTPQTAGYPVLSLWATDWATSEPMHFAYLDEAGNTGQNLRDPDAPIHLIGALLVPEDRISGLFAAIDKIAQDSAKKLGTSPYAELHGVELTSGKGAFKGQSVSDRLEILAALARLPAESDWISISGALSKVLSLIGTTIPTIRMTSL